MKHFIPAYKSYMFNQFDGQNHTDSHIAIASYTAYSVESKPQNTLNRVLSGLTVSLKFSLFITNIMV